MDLLCRSRGSPCFSSIQQDRFDCGVKDPDFDVGGQVRRGPRFYPHGPSGQDGLNYLRPCSSSLASVAGYRRGEPGHLQSPDHQAWSEESLWAVDVFNTRQMASRNRTGGSRYSCLTPVSLIVSLLSDNKDKSRADFVGIDLTLYYMSLSRPKCRVRRQVTPKEMTYPTQTKKNKKTAA